MRLEENGRKPLFLQIRDRLEDAVLTGVYPEESQVPSTTELSVAYRINPATALKGVNQLVQEEILFKKRGLGVFVAQGAVEKVRSHRQKSFRETFFNPMIREAQRLEITKEQLMQWMEETEDERH